VHVSTPRPQRPETVRLREVSGYFITQVPDKVYSMHRALLRPPKNLLHTALNPPPSVKKKSSPRLNVSCVSLFRRPL